MNTDYRKAVISRLPEITKRKEKAVSYSKMILMKKNFLAHTLLLSLTFFAACTPFCVQAAAKDDPGAGRLSGIDIPKEFYEDANPDTSDSTLIRRYGGFQTYSPYTNAYYTHQDQFTGIPIINGVDVSEYQKSIDWTTVKASGIDFAFIRVGGRGWGASGGMYNDSTYAANMQNAIAAGVNVGIYVFSQAITPAEAEEEAQFILDRIGTYHVTMPLILDYEFASGSSNGGRLKNANLSKEAATNVCLAFCNKIAAAGYTPMVYANPDMLNNHLNAATISNSYPIWLANYTTNTSYNGTFTYWQYSSQGTVSGIPTKVDMNFYYNVAGDNLASATITPIPDQIYTGSPITPAFTVTMKDKVLTAGTDYSVTYEYNTDIGTAKATITGLNGFTGTRYITFNIVPEAMTSLSIAARSKSAITLSWDKHNSASGYEIYRASSANGSYKKVATISSRNTTSFKNSGLSASECYYYKIRMYMKNSGGGTNYSDYSPVVSSYTKPNPTKMALPKYNVNLYADKSIDASVVAAPKKNDPLQIIYGTYDDNGTRWYYVSHGSVKGYVPGYQVKTGKKGQIKTSKVNVRKSRSVLSKRLTRLSKGKTVTVLSSKKKGGITWYKVRFKKNSKTYNGYISSAYVKIK